MLTVIGINFDEHILSLQVFFFHIDFEIICVQEENIDINILIVTH